MVTGGDRKEGKSMDPAAVGPDIIGVDEQCVDRWSVTGRDNNR